MTDPIVTLALTEAEALVVVNALGGVTIADLVERTRLSTRDVMNARGSVINRIADAMANGYIVWLPQSICDDADEVQSALAAGMVDAEGNPTAPLVYLTAEMCERAARVFKWVLGSDEIVHCAWRRDAPRTRRGTW